MISYKDIPVSIKESHEICNIRKKAPFWQSNMMLRIYVDAFNKGIKPYEGQDTDNASDSQMMYIATYYVLRKEFFKRMSPLVSTRSEEMILLDNKKLMDMFDKSLYSESEEDADRYISEICLRMS